MINSLKQYVLGFVFDQEGGVLLIKKNRPDYMAGKFNGIGGKIEAEETPLDAVMRELHEETGLKGKGFTVREIGQLVGHDFQVFLFRMICPRLEYDTRRGFHSKTDEKVIRVPLTEVSKLNLMPNLAWILPFAQIDGSGLYVTFSEKQLDTDIFYHNGKSLKNCRLNPIGGTRIASK